MFFGREIFAFFFVLMTVTGFCADVVTTTYVPDSEKDNPNPTSRTEIVQIVFEPGEEKVAQDLLRNSVQDAYKSNPKATFDILCARGGALSSAECGALRKTLSEHEGRESYSFEEVPGNFSPKESGDGDSARIGSGLTTLAPLKGEAPPLVPPGGDSQRAGGDPPAEPPPTSTGLPPRQPSDWKGVLTFVRTISSGVTVGVTATLSKGANWWQALIVGGTAGAWSGLMQWKNRERLNWQANQGWLNFDPPEPHERAGLLKRYIKRAIQTGLYAALLSTGFYASGLNQDLVSPEQAQRILLTVAESLYTQTAWEALNQEWTEAAIRRNPNRAWLYKRLSGLGSLLQATINVTANALNVGGVHLGGVHLGTVISGTVGTLGTLVYGWRWVPGVIRRPVEGLGSAVAGACSAVLRRVGGGGQSAGGATP